jgi:hypothetical protein
MPFLSPIRNTAITITITTTITIMLTTAHPILDTVMRISRETTGRRSARL